MQRKIKYMYCTLNYMYVNLLWHAFDLKLIAEHTKSKREPNSSDKWIHTIIFSSKYPTCICSQFLNQWISKWPTFQPLWLGHSSPCGRCPALSVPCAPRIFRLVLSRHWGQHISFSSATTWTWTLRQCRSPTACTACSLQTSPVNIQSNIVQQSLTRS